jgi:hypothetical protein
VGLGERGWKVEGDWKVEVEQVEVWGLVGALRTDVYIVTGQ